MIRIGINGRFYRAGVTGVQRFAREVTEHLARRSDVVLLLPSNARTPADFDIDTKHGRLAGHAWEQLELAGMAKRAGCDITLNMSGTAPVRGGPHAIVVHDVLPLTHPQFFSRRFAQLYRTVLTRAIPSAAAVITVSRTSRHAIESVFGPHPGLHVVTQGFEPFASPAPGADVARIREQLGTGRAYLLACGRGDPRKNLAFLDPVMGELSRRGRNIALVVTGSPAGRVHGRSRDPIAGRVVFTGHVSDSDMRALYTGALALAFPSLAEGFGRPPFEAVACGTPALVADVEDTPPEMRAVAQVLPFEACEWADAIERLIDEPALRHDWAAAGTRAMPGSSWNTCAAQVLDACSAGAGRARPLRTTAVSPAHAVRP